jgi:hypothetical protein
VDISNPSDLSVGFDESIATVSSSATQPGAKKSRAKRGPGAKAGRKKTKKDEPSELLDESTKAQARQEKVERGYRRIDDELDGWTYAEEESVAAFCRRHH